MSDTVEEKRKLPSSIQKNVQDFQALYAESGAALELTRASVQSWKTYVAPYLQLLEVVNKALEDEKALNSQRYGEAKIGAHKFHETLRRNRETREAVDKVSRGYTASLRRTLELKEEGERIASEVRTISMAVLHHWSAHEPLNVIAQTARAKQLRGHAENTALDMAMAASELSNAFKQTRQAAQEYLRPAK